MISNFEDWCIKISYKKCRYRYRYKGMCANKFFFNLLTVGKNLHKLSCCLYFFLRNLISISWWIFQPSFQVNFDTYFLKVKKNKLCFEVNIHSSLLIKKTSKMNFCKQTWAVQTLKVLRIFFTMFQEGVLGREFCTFFYSQLFSCTVLAGSLTSFIECSSVLDSVEQFPALHAAIQRNLLQWLPIQG